MIVNVQHPIYGDIVYEEGFWLGKKFITINSVPAKWVGKNEFLLESENNVLNIKLKGGYTVGASLIINDDIIELTAKPKWYEVVLSILIFAFVLSWGSNEFLRSIIPVPGGALGGAASGIMGLLNLMMMKKRKKVWQKLLTFLIFFFGTFIALAILGYLVLFAIAYTLYTN